MEKTLETNTLEDGVCIYIYIEVLVGNKGVYQIRQYRDCLPTFPTSNQLAKHSGFVL